MYNDFEKQLKKTVTPGKCRETLIDNRKFDLFAVLNFLL